MVALSFRIPEFTVPISQHTITVTRYTGREQTLCTNYGDTKNKLHESPDGSAMFMDLQEFSAYSIAVNTDFRYKQATAALITRVNIDIITLSSGKVEP